MNNINKTLICTAIVGTFGISTAYAGGTTTTDGKTISHSTEKTVSDNRETSSKIEENTSIDFRKKVDISGEMTVSGEINLEEAASSLIQDEQELIKNSVTNNGSTNSTTLGENVGFSASGNVTFNATSGTNNLQGNAVSIAEHEEQGSGPSLANSGILMDQTGLENNVNNSDASNDVSVSGSFKDAQGNINLNASSGTLNSQKNNLAITVSWADLSKASVKTRQDLWKNTTTNTNTKNSATLDAGAFSGAKGNVGVNIASGTGNLQSNSMSIASFK